MFESILAFLGATAVLAISPGPDNIYVLTQSIANGRKAGLIAFGVSALIAASPKIFWAIKIFGAAYLVFLAYKIFKSDASIAFSEGAPKKSYGALFKQGVIMNILNPKVTIFFLAFFPAFLWDPQGNTVYQFYVLGLLFMLASFLIFGSFAWLAGSISSYLKKHKNAGLVLKWLQIIVFVGIALFILIP
jgi:threonine/homoserine/homoserine lactone efflux protein